jgi:hypothetical protein
MRSEKSVHAELLAAAAMILACGGSNEPATPANVDARADRSAFSVGGTLTGLSSSATVVLQDNGADDLSRTGDGSFVFATRLRNHAPYDVTVRTQPAGATCSVANGTGTVAGANVTNVAVTCAPIATPGTYTVGGTISGIVGTVVLQDDGGDDLTLSADGAFTFATPLADGATYDVTVASASANLSCWVQSGGTGTIAGAAVTGVTVLCSYFPGYYAYAGYCIVDEATSQLTGYCMDLSTCAVGPSTFCASVVENPPTIQAYCGPTLDSTLCWY